MNLDEPLRQRLGAGTNDAPGELDAAVVVNPEHSPTGGAQAGIHAQNAAQHATPHASSDAGWARGRLAHGLCLGQDGVGEVGVGEHALDVVKILEGIDQAQQGAGL